MIVDNDRSDMVRAALSELRGSDKDDEATDDLTWTAVKVEPLGIWSLQEVPQGQSQ